MSTLFGVSLSEEFIEMSQATYPNNQDIPFHAYAELAIEIATKTLKLRHGAAVSGAMRWEWSQEAPIGGEAFYVLDYRNFEKEQHYGSRHSRPD